jgi:phosphoadenosine phosphosulfate reductase
MPYIEGDVQRIIEALTPLTWEQRLTWIAQQQMRSAFSTSFGLEDQMLTHTIAVDRLPITVFTLDTGRLFEETYHLQQETSDRYSLTIQTYYPDPNTLQQFVSEKGINSFYQSVENRKQCCAIRKVEPLQRALKNVDLWISGLRREQSEARHMLPVAEWDAAHQLIKIYPLIDVTAEQLQKFIATNRVPYNPLHDQGYPSIGCAPCTRAIQPGEHPRAGRWWWENGNEQECGLHVVNGRLVQVRPTGGVHAY